MRGGTIRTPIAERLSRGGRGTSSGSPATPPTPILREAFGCSAALVDLGGHKACDQASYPDDNPSLALSKVTGAASQTTVLNDHGKHNPVAEVADFLKPDLQLLVRLAQRQVAASLGTNRWIASYAWSWISGSRKSGTISAWSMTGPVIVLAALA